MIDYNIKYVMIGDVKSKKLIYDWSSDMVNLSQLKKEAMSEFEQIVSNKNISRDIKKISIQEASFIYRCEDDIFYSICFDKNFIEINAIHLLEELIKVSFGVRIKKASVSENSEKEKIIEEFMYLVNKYQQNKKDTGSKKTGKPEFNDVNYENEKRVINAKNSIVNIKFGRNVLSPKEEEEKIQKTIKMRQLRIILILSFLTVGIVLAIILPIVLS